MNARISGVTALNGLKAKVEEDGFAIIQNCLDEVAVHQICKEFDDTRTPQRDLLSILSVRQLAISRPVREIMETAMGPECFAEATAGQKSCLEESVNSSFASRFGISLPVPTMICIAIFVAQRRILSTLRAECMRLHG